MTQHNLFIVIPVHNRKEATRLCLESLSRQTFGNMQVVVIDDGSTDGTSEMVQHEFSETILLKADGNLWWAGATNLGVRHAFEQGADLILTINNDVIVKEDYIQKLVDAHKEYPDALIGSIELSRETPPRLLYAGMESFNPWTAKYVRRGQTLQTYSGEFEGLLPTYSLPGRGVLIPGKVFDEIGLYDEDCFPQYAADFDFSRRAAEAGFKLLVHAENPVFSPYDPHRAGGSRQTWGQFFKTFSDFRTSNYLPVLVRYSFRHHPRKWYFPIYQMIELLRIVLSFMRVKKQNKVPHE